MKSSFSFNNDFRQQINTIIWLLD